MGEHCTVAGAHNVNVLSGRPPRHRAGAAPDHRSSSGRGRYHSKETMEECRDCRLEEEERALFSLSAAGSEREFCPRSPCRWDATGAACLAGSAGTRKRHGRAPPGCRRGRRVKRSEAIPPRLFVFRPTRRANISIAPAQASLPPQLSSSPSSSLSLAALVHAYSPNASTSHQPHP